MAGRVPGRVPRERERVDRLGGMVALPEQLLTEVGEEHLRGERAVDRRKGNLSFAHDPSELTQIGCVASRTLVIDPASSMQNRAPFGPQVSS